MTNQDSAQKAAEEFKRAQHLKFAEAVYQNTFDESKMTPEEIKNKRAQIPTLGIVPFDAGFRAGVSWTREHEVKKLNRIILKELTENDELGAEYTYVNALREENKKLREALEHLFREMNNGQTLEPDGPNHKYIERALRGEGE